MLLGAFLAATSAASALARHARGTGRRPAAHRAAATSHSKCNAQGSSTASGQDAPLGSVGRRLPAAVGEPAQPAEGLTINDLPNDLLGQIFMTAMDEQGSWEPGKAATQVCKRWNAVFYSDSCKDLWRIYCGRFGLRDLVDGQPSGADLRLLQRICPLIQAASFEVEPDPDSHQTAAQHLPDFLSALGQAQLTELLLNEVPLMPAALQALAQLHQLRQLAVAADESTASSGSLADAIPCLSSLEQLYLYASSVGSSVLAAVCHLPALQRLKLHSTEAPLPDLSPLTALAGSLTILDVTERISNASGLQLPRAADFPKLQRLFIAAPVLQVPGNGCLTVAVAEGAWDVEEDEGRPFDPACFLLPAPTVAITCSEDGVMVDIRNAQIQKAAGLLPAILDAVVPAGHSIATLQLRCCHIMPAMFEGCAERLAAVNRLALIMCFSHSAGLTLEPALDSLLQRTPELRELAIKCQPGISRYGTLADGLPAVVATLRHLTVLALNGTRLPHLDGVLEGLPDLVHLDLRHNRLQRLPDPLSHCSSLVTLWLGGNDGLTAEGLDQHIVDVLAALPMLQVLQLPHTAAQLPAQGPAQVRARLAAAAPYISEVEFADADPASLQPRQFEIVFGPSGMAGLMALLHPGAAGAAAAGAQAAAGAGGGSEEEEDEEEEEEDASSDSSANF